MCHAASRCSDGVSPSRADPIAPQSPATGILEFAYQYDDIGNRITSTDLGMNRTYAANSLNQYTDIVEGVDAFVPQFDDDGNQKRVITSTGIWSVSYNGENRPILWECGATSIVMSLDRMGRRVEYAEAANETTNRCYRFMYDGYRIIQRLNGSANNVFNIALGWDPTEMVALRPLIMQTHGGGKFLYAHDGNKNVSELVSCQRDNCIVAHYEYTPFGMVSETSSSVQQIAEINPFQWSSEYVDVRLGLVRYNYRYYNPLDGRWLQKDPVGEFFSRNLMGMIGNSCVGNIDNLGLCCCGNCQIKGFNSSGPLITGFRILSGSDKEFAKISVDQLIEDFGSDVIDDFVKKHGSSIVRSIYDLGKEMFNQKEKWETIANFCISSGFLMQPQLEVTTKISYFRRDCVRKWWQFGMGDCRWSSWKIQKDTKSEWESPPEEIFGDSRFAVSEIITNPSAVFEKIRVGMQSILETVGKRREFDVETYKSQLGCESIK